MDKLAIISRYNEDVSWVRQLNCDYKIYNKGNIIHELPCEALPNVGRESQTFLHFIVSNYYKIKDSTLYCFLQGRPFDHLITVDDINNATDEGFKSFGNRHFQEPLTASVNNFFPGGIPVIEFCDLLFKRNVFVEQGRISFLLGGQFAVSGARIKKRCIKFYKFVASHLNTPNPLEGHIMERIWGLIFDDTLEDRFTSYDKARKRAVVGANWQGPLQ